MRVAFFSWRDLAHPQAGGSEVVVDRLARGLAARGEEVTLFAGDPVATREYPVLPLGGRFTQYVRAPFALRRHFPAPDVVVDVENGIPYFSPMWQRAPVVNLVHHVHVDQWQLYFAKPIAAVGRALEAHLMPRVYRNHRYVAVSPSTKRELAALGIAPDRIEVIEMGIDPVEHRVPESPEPTFLVLGRLVPHKRVESIIEMWESVRPKVGGRLVIAGDGPELAALQAMAGADVEFTGFIDASTKARLLGEAWLLVHAAMHEGWGTVVMEAAAAGTPTLAFDVLGVRDSVANGTSGVLVDSRDAFIAEWIRLASNDDARRSLAAGARARADAHSWDAAIDAFHGVIRAAAAVPA
ncbi:MAG: glycosyltransferase family 4 protein [Acidimicrobiia bacterium]